MNNNFYKAFEDKHRGSRELIKSRLGFYLPFLNRLKQIKQETCIALDIGCGRGEWLELLKENNIKAKGVDLDKDMLNVAKELNLDVILDNGIKYLSKLESSSLDIISAFHVVEHISFEELQILVQEAFRVLKPAGLLILETPNSENLFVSSYGFYMDPTHTKPIPSELLAFITEHIGFVQNKIVGLNESKALVEKQEITLNEAIKGVSPDYAVIAQKPADEDIIRFFEQEFSQDYGLTLSTLVSRFDNRLHHSNQRLNQLEQSLNQFDKRNQELSQEITSLLNSSSWKITSPLRKTKKTLKELKKWIKTELIKKQLIKIKQQINTNPKLKNTILKLLKPFPNLEHKLKHIDKIPIEEKSYLIYENLNSSAKDIYNNLKSQIEQNKGKTK